MFCRYFLPLSRLSFLLMVFFAVQKLLSLMWFHLFIFAFLAFGSSVRSKKSSPGPKSRSLLPMFYSGVMAPSLTYKSLIHFELTFRYGVRKWSRFIFLYVVSSFPSTIYWRDFFFLHCVFWFLCQKLFAYIHVVLFLASQFCSTGLRVCFSVNTMLFWLS